MPIGMVVMIWDERTGAEVIAKYPEEIDLEPTTLMQVFSTHEYSGDAGLINLMVGSLNIASYYAGPESPLYVLLLLSIDEDADLYEGGMADIARLFLKTYDKSAYKEIIPSAFQRLSAFPSLTEVQLIALTYQDEIKRMIINRLREEGVVLKSELLIWLKDRYLLEHDVDTFQSDLDAVLIDLVKRDIVKETSVKGMPSSLVLLTNDILIMRAPPNQFLKNPVENGLPPIFVKDYQALVKHFFRDYIPTEEDCLKLIDMLINSETYKVLKLLRSSIVTKNELEKLKKKGVEDIEGTLKLLWERQMIQTFQSEGGIEHYALICDYFVSLIFPKFILKVIKNQYESKSKSTPVLTEYLKVLEEGYFGLKSKSKSKD